MQDGINDELDVDALVLPGHVAPRRLFGATAGRAMQAQSAAAIRDGREMRRDVSRRRAADPKPDLKGRRARGRPRSRC